jgi:hypothetical protein
MMPPWLLQAVAEMVPDCCGAVVAGGMVVVVVLEGSVVVLVPSCGSARTARS